MRIGVPREIKTDESRVALTPAGVTELVRCGHDVLIESGAGERTGMHDADYERAGAVIVSGPEDAFAATLVVKVKEPELHEVEWLSSGRTLFTFLHLAASEALTAALLASGATCLAYETVESADGRLPLLAPMSEVAGRMSAQAGAAMLEHSSGGRGVLLGGLPGVAPAKVMVVGGGVAGSNAAMVAAGMGASVLVFDRSLDRLRLLETVLPDNCMTAFSSPAEIEAELPDTDLVIGAVLTPGGRAPHVLSTEALGDLRAGSVLVDVAIDQGGCFASSRPTVHSDPSYVVADIVHYCVSNIPAAVPTTSTRGLTNATLPYIIQLANGGIRRALDDDPGLRCGLNVAAGELTYEPVALAHGLPFVEPEAAIARLSA